MLKHFRQRIRDRMRPWRSFRAKLTVLEYLYQQYKRTHKHTVKDIEFELVKNHTWSMGQLDEVPHSQGIDRNLSESPREYQEEGLIWTIQGRGFRLTRFAIQQIKKRSRRSYLVKGIIGVATSLVFLYGLFQLVRDLVSVLTR